MLLVDDDRLIEISQDRHAMYELVYEHDERLHNELDSPMLFGSWAETYLEQ